MDSLPFDGTPDGDLMLCEGVAYQRDGYRVTYGDDYLAKFDAYDAGIERAVNKGRCSMLMRNLHTGGRVLDYGAGNGSFVREARAWGFVASGYDVIPAAAQRLRDSGLYADPDPTCFDAVTLWDVVEHLDVPEPLLSSIRGRLFASLPIFDDLREIRTSKHYRPGEHLRYFTADGFVAWIESFGFRLTERSDHEIKAGRDSIGAFAFYRD